MQIINPNAPPPPQTYKISGSFAQSLVINTLIVYSSRCAMSSFNSPISTMINLSQTLKAFLAVSPLIPGLLTPIPTTWIVHKNGGKKEILALFGISLTGMLSLTTLAACTDITSIDRFDWRYGLLLTSGLLIGQSSNSAQLIIDTLKWAPKKEYVPHAQLTYSFIVDSSYVTTPILIYYLKPLGFLVPFTLYSGIALISEIAVLEFFHVSPYNQYKTKFSKERARELAIESGELEHFIGNYDTIPFINILKQNIHVLLDRRIILLSFSLLASFGSSWFTRLILPSALTNGFGLSQEEAVITASLAYLIAITSRPIADKLISKWDNRSGGVKVHLLGCGLTISGSLALTFNLPHWALFSSLAAFNVGYGFNMITPLNIAIAWSKPANEKLDNFNPGTMFGLFGTLGTFGGILLPLLLGLMVDNGGVQDYQNYFYIIMTMMLISAISVPIVDIQVRSNNSKSIFKNPSTFFGSIRSLASNHEYKFNHQAAIEVPEQTDVYLEKYL